MYTDTHVAIIFCTIRNIEHQYLMCDTSPTGRQKPLRISPQRQKRAGLPPAAVNTVLASTIGVFSVHLRFPTCELRAKHIEGYVPLPSPKGLAAALATCLDDTDLRSWRKQVDQPLQLPALELSTSEGTLWPFVFVEKLAAILGTCPAACADRLRLPPEIDACPLFDSSPCVDHGLPPYATLKPYFAEEASVTSSSRQTDHITGWRNPSPFSGHWIAAVMPAADNPLCLFVQLAAILGTCPAACADRLRLPPEIDACPLFDSSPCVDHGLPPYATLKPYFAEEASVTSSSRQTDHITGWRNPSPFSGHWIAAVMPAADNPLCLFVQLAAILGTCPAACADRLRLPPEIDACPLFDSSPCVDHGLPPYATLKPYFAEEASVTSSSRQTDHITGWRNPSPFSGHWIAAVMPAADNPLCLFVQEGLYFGCLPLVSLSPTEHPDLISLPEVTIALSAVEAVVEVLGTSITSLTATCTQLLQVEEFLSVAAPFGLLQFTQPSVVRDILRDKELSAPADGVSKVPAWRPTAFHGKPELRIQLREIVQCTQCERPDVSPAAEVTGVLQVHAELECRELSVTVVSCETLSPALALGVRLTTYQGAQGAQTWCIHMSPPSTRPVEAVRYSLPPSVAVPPILGLYSMRVSAHLFTLGRIRKSSLMPSCGSVSLARDKCSLLWTIGQKFPASSQEVSLTGTVHFEEQPADINQSTLCTGLTSYAQVEFCMMSRTLSGCSLDPKSVLVTPLVKYKLILVRPYGLCQGTCESGSSPIVFLLGWKLPLLRATRTSETRETLPARLRATKSAAVHAPALHAPGTPPNSQPA
ncbi:uncharacterized protein LOC119167755 isoform X3 [Rhipicephalus microplus]|uniref:uncharacterized protein LOC119167755 isoform X3 n=1 Tax=Rhipicephalus microplus TaxID=6941 RepID=UPI003F6BE5CD